jgi:hypothetical protein
VEGGRERERESGFRRGLKNLRKDIPFGGAIGAGSFLVSPLYLFPYRPCTVSVISWPCVIGGGGVCVKVRITSLYRFKFRREDKRDESWRLPVAKQKIILFWRVLFSGFYRRVFIDSPMFRRNTLLYSGSKFSLPSMCAGYFLGLFFETEDEGDLFL